MSVLTPVQCHIIPKQPPELKIYGFSPKGFTFLPEAVCHHAGMMDSLLLAKGQVTHFCLDA